MFKKKKKYLRIRPPWKKCTQKARGMCRVDVLFSKPIALIFSLPSQSSYHLKLPNVYEPGKGAALGGSLQLLGQQTVA